MASRDAIIAYLDELLEPDGFDDLCPNGLQVPGAEQVELVVTGVTAQQQLFDRAVAAGAQLVLCHHGLFWNFHPRTIGPAMKRRLQTVFDADISVAGYHLPLDAHPDVGNNALLCAALGFERAEPFGAYKGRTIGYVARSAPGVAIGELVDRCSSQLGQAPLIFDSGPERVHTLGIVSGAAASTLREAIDLGLDAFMTGEPAEHVMADAHEAGVHFLGAGHYATETLGVRRLGELLVERFGVRHEFVDIPNPV